MALAHHDACFGCGQANLFGLLLELELTGAGTASGRAFIKQDHQGADRGFAHEGVVAAALTEAMGLLCGVEARAQAVTTAYLAPAPVGTFLNLVVGVQEVEDGILTVTASATSEGQLVARAQGTYERR